MTLQLQTAATGIARSAHYVIPTGQTLPIQTLLLEPQRTNQLIRSEEFDTWTDLSSCAVTANAIAAPDGTLTADLLTPTSNASARFRSYTATGDGEKCYSIFVKAGTSPQGAITIYDSTAAVTRHGIRITWTAGVPSLSTTTGTGTIYPVETLGNGWYRILFTATGIVAANTNTFFCYPHNTAPGTGSAYFWGAQAENAVVPSSYIKTEGTTITRNADSLYFPFTAPPQAMTVYVRGVHRGTRYESGSYIWQISLNNTNPRIQVNRPAGTTPIHFQSVNAAGTFTTINPSGAEPIVGDLVEFRNILLTNGNLGYGLTLNNGTESVSTPVTGTALEAAWSGQRLYVGTNGSGAAGLFAFTHLTIATGEQSRATMRQLAGVV